MSCSGMITLSADARAQLAALARSDPRGYVEYATKASAMDRLLTAHGLAAALAGERLIAVLNHRYDIHLVTTSSAGPCFLTVSDVVVEQEFVRISDEELRNAVDRMTELAIRAALSEPKG